MKTVALIIALSFPALAHAEQVSAEDALRFEAAAQALRAAKAEAEAAALKLDALREAIAKKYKLVDGDQVDPQTREIKRAAAKQAAAKK